jgi:hypothetical protein
VYQARAVLLQEGGRGLADPGLTSSDWADFGRRLERRLAASTTPGEAGQKAPFLVRSKWAWAGASLIVLAFIGTYLAVIRPRGVQEPVLVSFEDSVIQVLGEVGSNPGLENSFNREVVASIEEAVRPAEEEAPVSFGDNPMFWESLSEGELAYIESELRKEQGHGGLP